MELEHLSAFGWAVSFSCPMLGTVWNDLFLLVFLSAHWYCSVFRTANRVFAPYQMVQPHTPDIPFLSFISTILCCFTLSFVHAVSLCTEKSREGLTHDNEHRLCHGSWRVTTNTVCVTGPAYCWPLPLYHTILSTAWSTCIKVSVTVVRVLIVCRSHTLQYKLCCYCCCCCCCWRWGWLK